MAHGAGCHGECWERSLPQGKPAPLYSEDALDEVYPTGRTRIKRPQHNLLFDDRIGAQYVCNWACILSTFSFSAVLSVLFLQSVLQRIPASPDSLNCHFNLAAILHPCNCSQPDLRA